MQMFALVELIKSVHIIMWTAEYMCHRMQTRGMSDRFRLNYAGYNYLSIFYFRHGSVKRVGESPSV